MDLWAFATSPHGLGLSEAAFWWLSPREYFALRKVWQSHRDLTIGLYAQLQASLHNLWSTGKRWKPEDFTGKPRKPQTWQEDAAAFSAYATALGGKDYRDIPSEDKDTVVSEWCRRMYERRIKLHPEQVN